MEVEKFKETLNDEMIHELLKQRNVITSSILVFYSSLEM